MTSRRTDLPTGSAGAFAALERRAQRQVLWVVLLVAVIAVLAVIAVRQDRALSSQSDVLTLIEAQSEQQVCSDAVEAEYEIAVARVVLGAMTDDDGMLGVARGSLEKALARLERIDDLCPPVDAPGSP